MSRRIRLSPNELDRGVCKGGGKNVSARMNYITKLCNIDRARMGSISSDF